jgi:tetraacyldisaccharide 4'-kinase
MSLATDIYSSVARERRKWYARHPGWRRRLNRPVVSVGNIAVGGSGKTPVVALVARLLAEAGHRPAILTRGYGRAAAPDGVTVVSDGRRLLADLDHAGDEPLMLARQLPRVPVLVSSDRYLAGRLAENRFDCTVHVLDDGFQHFELERDVDLVLLSPEDVERPLTLPAGRLREPPDVLRAASALIVGDAGLGRAAEVGKAVGVRDVFVLERALDRPRLFEPTAGGVVPDIGARVLAVAGLARPEQFFAGVGAAGWTLAGRMAFRDHHPFTRADMERIGAAMRAARAKIVLTTEKDLVRMEPLGPLPVPVAWVPLRVSVEPAEEFRDWVMGRIGSRLFAG